jgi:hypothetical protein
MTAIASMRPRGTPDAPRALRRHDRPSVKVSGEGPTVSCVLEAMSPGRRSEVTVNGPIGIGRAGCDPNRA